MPTRYTGRAGSRKSTRRLGSGSSRRTRRSDREPLPVQTNRALKRAAFEETP